MVALFGGIVKILETASGLNFEQIMNPSFGRSSEKMADASQISFREVDGTIVFFNEAEAVCDLDASEPEHLEESAPRPVKKKGKKEQDLSGLPTHRIDHYSVLSLLQFALQAHQLH